MDIKCILMLVSLDDLMQMKLIIHTQRSQRIQYLIKIPAKLCQIADLIGIFLIIWNRSTHDYMVFRL